jgi:hypothetical protein
VSKAPPAVLLLPNSPFDGVSEVLRELVVLWKYNGVSSIVPMVEARSQAGSIRPKTPRLPARFLGDSCSALHTK